jgi:hypothetical protein
MVDGAVKSRGEDDHGQQVSNRKLVDVGTLIPGVGRLPVYL